jgi:hypothetical protein
MGASPVDSIHQSLGTLLDYNKDTFPYKEFVLGVMFTVFLWEEYLRYHTSRPHTRPRALAQLIAE